MKKYYLLIIVSIIFLAFFAGDALAYKLYTNFESYAAQNTFGEYQGVEIINNPPKFISFNLPHAIPRQTYEGHIEAYDLDGDSLKWGIELLNLDFWSSNGWEPWFSCTDRLSLGNINTPSSFINELRACKVGNAGMYNFEITIDDGRGGLVSTTSSINVDSRPDIYFRTPKTEIAEADREDNYSFADEYSQDNYNFVYTASSTNPLSFRVLSSSTTETCPHSLLVDGFPMGWSEQLVAGYCLTFDILADFNPIGNSYFKYLKATTTHSLDLTSVDKFGNKSKEKNIKITVVNNKPNILLQDEMIESEICTETCQSQEYVCGEHDICGVTFSCGECLHGECSENGRECMPTDACGNQYTTVTIGEQEWLGENIDCNYNECLFKTWVDGSDEGWCGHIGVGLGDPYENEGMFYQWSAAMNGSTEEGAQGICPNGWHIPTDAEWHTLESYLWSQAGSLWDCDVSSTRWMEHCSPSGDKLKSAAYCSSLNGENCGTSGFDGIPAGYSMGPNAHSSRDLQAVYWSSSQVDSEKAWYYGLERNESWIWRWEESKFRGLSVRCIKD